MTVRSLYYVENYVYGKGNVVRICSVISKLGGKIDALRFLLGKMLKYQGYEA